MRSLLSFISVVCVGLSLITAPAAAEKRVALVIGINDYPKLKTSNDPTNGQLRKAVADAEAMSAVLSALGFEVELARNVDRTGFLTALGSVTRKIAVGDTVFVFFAGHGVALKGSNLLLPSDMPPIDPEADQLVLGLSIAETDIINAVREKGAGLVILTLDACRDNPIEEFARKQARIQGRPFRSTSTMRSVGLEARPTSGVFAIYSAGIGQTALDRLNDQETERNSVFTRVFATKLREPGRHLSDVMEDVKEEVAKLAAKVIDRDTRRPHRQFPAYYNETLGGKIFLAGLPKPPEPPAIVQPAPPDPDAAVRGDYVFAERAGTVAAWDAFLARHPSGYYPELARVQRGKLAVVVPPTPPAVPGTPVRPAVGISPSADSLKPKDVFKDCDTCPEMVVVPSGSFTMGSPANEAVRSSDEGPQHRVTFSRQFAVGRFSVTFNEWDNCIADGGCKGYRPEDEGWGRGRRPVIYVSWEDAKAYVEWLSRKTGKSYRLLTESEREYVTRAGTISSFWTGRTISTSQANYNGNSTYEGGAKGEYREKTVPVDLFAPNPWGLHQVHGNVWEWVEDCWNNNYQNAPTDGSAWTSGDCSRRIYRGGAWYNPPSNLRAARRPGRDVHERFNGLGFRVARTLTP